jgi:hypothetical protein
MADEIITGGAGRHVQVRETKGWTRARRARFLEVLATSANVRLSARAVGVDTTGAYALRKRDAAFAELWDEAMAQGYDTLEAALLERARGGVNAIVVEGRELTLVDEAAGPGIQPAAKLTEGGVEMDVKLAQWLLERQDRRVGRDQPGRVVGKAPDRAAVEAKILKKLDQLAKRRDRAR